MQRRFQLGLTCLLATLALCAGLVAAGPIRSAGSPSVAVLPRIVTQLQPGWNMIGWVGPDTSSQSLFLELPELHRISVRDAEQGRYRRAWRDRYEQLPTLTAGMGLWLLIGSEAPVWWDRAIALEGADLRLHRGLNLVGWTGDDGTPVREALHGLGDAALDAWVRDAAGERYVHSDLRSGGQAGAQPVLRRGDALWIQVAEPVDWEQPGSLNPPVVFLGEIPAQIRREIVAEYESVQAFFAERFEVVPVETPLYVGADTEAVRATHVAAFERDPEDGFCGRGTLNGHIQVQGMRCAYPTRWLQLEVGQTAAQMGLRFEVTREGARRRLSGGPEWLIRGTQRYAVALYQEAAGFLNYRALSRERAEAATRSAVPLREMTGEEDDLNTGLAFLAVEWLAARAGDPALFEYHRLLPTSETWDEAFATAFGITVEDFYAEFEAYRAEVAPPLPHLTGGAGGFIQVIGDVPEETQAAIAADLAVVQAFMTERFGAERAEFTLYVGPDTPSLLAALPGFNDSAICQQPGAGGLAAMALDLCGKYPRHDIWYIQSLIPPWLYPPRWLVYGADEYFRTAYAQEVKGENLDVRLAWLRGLASRTAHSLESRETEEGIIAAGGSSSRAVGYLAAGLLVTRAGPSSLLDFYEQQPAYTNWRRVFETTFGISVEDFYEEFEAYRAGLAQQ